MVSIFHSILSQNIIYKIHTNSLKYLPEIWTLCVLFLELKIESRVSCVLDKCLATDTHPKKYSETQLQTFKIKPQCYSLFNLFSFSFLLITQGHKFHYSLDFRLCLKRS